MIRTFLLAFLVLLAGFEPSFAQFRPGRFDGRGLQYPGSASPLYNFKTSQFTKTKAGFARVVAASGRAKIVVVGDSTSWGEGGGDSGSNNRINAKIRAWPTIAANRLTALGISSNWEGIFGSGATLAATVPITNLRAQYFAGWNPRSAWVLGSSLRLGGVDYENPTDGNLFSYTPAMSVDRFELYDLTAVGLGTLGYNIDGGATTTTSQNVAASFRSVVINAGSPGTHTLNLARSAGNAIVIGARAWNSTVPQVDILNVGMGSSKVSDWTTNNAAYSPLPSLAVLSADADLVIIDLTINDAAGGTLEASYKSGMQTLIDTAKAGGADVLLMTGNPTDTAFDTDAAQQATRGWIRDLALTNNLPLIDQFSLYGSYSALSGLGFMFNARHPNTAGYASLGTFVGDTLWTWTR